MNRSLENHILLVGTSFAAVPFLLYLKSLGYRVAVCGKRPDEPCVGLADRYYPVDYSDTAALSALVRSERFSALVPDCNDRSYLSAAIVAEEFGFGGYDSPDTVGIILNKAKFRTFGMQHGLPVPKAVISLDTNTDSCSGLSFPLMVKPVDSYSGRGIAKVEESSKLQNAIETAYAESRTEGIVVEEFKSGSLHSHSAWVRRGRVEVDFFVDEFCTMYPYQVNCSNYPSRIQEKTKSRVRECINELVGLMGLTEGLLHTQFILSGDGFYLIESTRRCPGDLYYYLISKATEAQYAENYVLPFLGRAFDIKKSTNEMCWLRHTVSLSRDVVFWGFQHGIDSHAIEIFPLRNVGSLVRQAPYGRMAILFARIEDRDTLFDITPRIHDLITVNEKAYSHEQ